MDGLLSALQTNWGGSPASLHDPGTLTGLLALTRLWQRGELEPEEVLASLREVDARIQEAIRETRADQEGSLEAGLAQRLADLEEAFVSIRSELYCLAEELESGAVDLAPLEECRRALNACSQALQDWAEAPVPICLRCGSREPGARCEPCGLDRLIPEIAGEEQDVSGAYLSEDYLLVYRNYRAVMDGEAGLTPLLASLVPIEARLAPLERLARLTGSPVLAEVSRGLSGLQRMRGVLSSRAARDLSAGWELLFQAALGLKSLLPQLLREVGREEEARRLELAERSSDGISLGAR